MSKLSRDKGRKFEQVAARKLRPLFGDRVKRGFQRRDGREAPDVDGTPFWIECKHAKCVNVRAALAQAVTATDGRPPVVIAQDNGVRVPMVVMRLDDWLDLVEREVPRLVALGVMHAGSQEASAGDEASSGEGGAEEEGA